MRLSAIRLGLDIISLLLSVLSIHAQSAQEPARPELAATATTQPPASAPTLPPLSADEPEATARPQPSIGGVTVDGRYFPPPLTGKERWDK